MRLGISLPQLDASSFDAAGFRSYVSRAEQVGFTSGWTIEQAVGPTPMLAPLELLAYAAACTEKLRLGVAVLVSSLHDPLQLAAAITTVDRLSHGRLDVGLAPGGGFRQFEAFGVDKTTFVRHFTEGLQLMKAAWSDEPHITFHGSFRTVEDLAIQPKPTQRPHPPIWFGANAPKALARAVRLGDGFLGAGSTPTGRFVEQVRTVRQQLETQQRDPATFAIGKRVYLAVADDPAEAERQVRAGLRRLYGAMPGQEAIPVFGTPGQVAAELATVVDAGAELIVLNPLGPDLAADRDQLERLAAEVLPQLGGLGE